MLFFLRPFLWVAKRLQRDNNDNVCLQTDWTTRRIECQEKHFINSIRKWKKYINFYYYSQKSHNKSYYGLSQWEVFWEARRLKTKLDFILK